MERPTKYQSEYAEQAERLCKLGMTDEELAEFFGCGKYRLDSVGRVSAGFGIFIHDSGNIRHLEAVKGRGQKGLR